MAALDAPSPGECAPFATRRPLHPKGAHALAWAARGFRVFPCLPDSPDIAIDHQKRPAIKNFAEHATTDEATVRGWWTERDYNIGLSPDYGHLFIDVDVKGEKQGEESLRLLEILDVLPRGLRNRTRSGGLHVILTKPTNFYVGQQNGWMPGIDLRGDRKNYILAPGSTVGGKPYTHIEGEPEPAPIALLEMMRKPAPTESPDRHNPLVELDTDSSVRRAIEYLRTEAPIALQGAHGDDTTVAVAMRLGDLGISREMQLDLMLEHWQEIGKAEPPWNPSDLHGKINSAWNSRANRPGCSSADAVFDDVSADVTGLERASVGAAEHRGKLLQTGGDFIAGFTPPEYLVHRILQRRYFYSLTAPTGAGKTAIALRLGAHVELGRRFGECEVEQGRFLYFAGENPDDVRMRWIAMAEKMGFDPSMGHFIPGVHSVSKMMARIHREAEKMGGFSLVIVDTSAAYFEGDEENDNVAMGRYARTLRKLTTLPGGPTVLALCHPVKNASADNLLPRGGGAYIAEVDGNLVSRSRTDKFVEIGWQGKFRGPDFDPIAVEIIELTSDKIRDSKGRHIPTVMAEPLSKQERAAKISDARSEQDALLTAMLDNEGASIARLAEKAEWTTGDGSPLKSKVHRLLKQLKNGGMVTNRNRAWALTEKGRQEAKAARAHISLEAAKWQQSQG